MAAAQLVPDEGGVAPTVAEGSPAVPSDNRYEMIQVVGQGAFATVTKARDLETNEVVAMKHMCFEDYVGDGIPSHILREVSVLRSIIHPNVVQLLGVHVAGPTDFHLVFEYIEMNLYDTIRQYNKENQLMPISRVIQYSQQLLNGIHACHMVRVMHRDLKPQNILIGPEGLKICDFGLARLISLPLKPYTHDVVTLWYRAPEILLGRQVYDNKVDMWSAGCIIAEMAMGMPTFPGDAEIDMIYKIMRLLGTPTEESWPGVSRLQHFGPTFPRWRPGGLEAMLEGRPELGRAGTELIAALLVMNPEARLSAREAKRHEWFPAQTASL